MSNSTPSKNPPAAAGDWIKSWLAAARDWAKREPLAATLVVTILVTLVYFYGFVPLFVKGVSAAGVSSTAAWAWQAWVGTQAHSKLVPFIFLGLLFYHGKKLRDARKAPSNLGLLFIAAGVLLFVLAARCLQPRFSLAAIPFLLYGSALFVWGKAVARIILFPCAFLIFLIPFGAIEQATFRLQFVITSAVAALSNLIGVQMLGLGTTLSPVDRSFNFMIDEGCSGINSLFAMMMLTAIYVHLTQDKLWKKVTIFAFSLVFAIVGNIGRIFTVVLVGKFIDPDLASGIYHDYSGFVFFPIALIAMLTFSRLLNVNWPEWLAAQQEAKHEPVKYDY